MGGETTTAGEIPGTLEGPGGAVPVQVLQAASYSLVVRFLDARPENPTRFGGLKLQLEARELALGACQFLPHHSSSTRRAGDAPVLGDGKLVFVDQLYDFASLYRSGAAIALGRRLEQLPVLWSRKENIRPAFREFVAELVFDLQVYRGLFDEIDRNLTGEPAWVRANVHRVVSNTEYANFRTLFDEKLVRLECAVRDLSPVEHERHGFYLRKHAWDIILASDFMRRTNLKPRGYAGDSQMMRMLYENRFQGETIFAGFVHVHPVQTAAAHAVRNRLELLTQLITHRSQERTTQPMRIISIASGPAWELRDLFQGPSDFERYEVHLLDQDDEALAEARETVTAVEKAHRRSMKVSFIKESVRTMMRTRDLASKWGRFSFLYSMGLFDYLTAPVAKVVLKRLYDLLEPGGELVVGNFHDSNPTRIYMEYWMDWVLLYRTEEEFLELAREIEGAESSVIFEATHSQMFLRMKKGA